VIDDDWLLSVFDSLCFGQARRSARSVGLANIESLRVHQVRARLDFSDFVLLDVLLLEALVILSPKAISSRCVCLFVLCLVGSALVQCDLLYICSCVESKFSLVIRAMSSHDVLEVDR
jgi:hypothetical protein